MEADFGDGTHIVPARSSTNAVPRMRFHNAVPQCGSTTRFYRISFYYGWLKGRHSRAVNPNLQSLVDAFSQMVKPLRNLYEITPAHAAPKPRLEKNEIRGELAELVAPADVDVEFLSALTGP